MKLHLREDELMWQRLETEIVVLDLKASKYFKLNGSGATLWERLSGGATEEELAQALIEAYGIDASRADADTKAFLKGLENQGMLA